MRGITIMTYAEWLSEFNNPRNLARYQEYTSRHQFPVIYRVWIRTIGGFPQY
jgi:hypothetical protein